MIQVPMPVLLTEVPDSGPRRLIEIEATTICSLTEAVGHGPPQTIVRFKNGVTIRVTQHLAETMNRRDKAVAKAIAELNALLHVV
jgi:hypothetical protein